MRVILSAMVLILYVHASTAQERPTVETVIPDASTAEVTWTTQTGVIYRVERATNLLSKSPWKVVNNVSSTGTSFRLDDTEARDDSTFYRVRATTNPVPTNSSLITFVRSDSGVDLAVKILTPALPRYSTNKAAVLVDVSGFIGSPHEFVDSPDFSEIGLIHVTYLRPGATSACGVASGGTGDDGGPLDMAAFRDVVRFAGGVIPNRDGRYLNDLIAVTPVYSNLGLYAASHTGLNAVNLLTRFSNDMHIVAYFVGWENPTVDAITAFDVGQIGNAAGTFNNSLYSYPSSYSPTNINISYASVRWASNYNGYALPYFDINGNGQPTLQTDYILPRDGVTIQGKRYYSRATLHALADRGEFQAGTNWPADLATTNEADAVWGYRDSASRYSLLSTTAPQLKVMLLCANDDHIQSLNDKPHLHQAYDGFRNTAGLWTRINPDRDYLAWASGINDPSYPDNNANTEPGNWNNLSSWTYRDTSGRSAPQWAAIAEMADRTQTSTWAADLSDTLVSTPNP